MYATLQKKNRRHEQPSARAAVPRSPKMYTFGGSAATIPQENAIQPKLRVNERHDPLEREANDVADQVMQISDRHLPEPVPKGAAPDRPDGLIARKCDSCAAEEESEKERVGLEAGTNPQTGAVPNSIASAISSARQSGGQPLSAESRRFFEPRFGQSLNHVRLHVGGRADGLASGLGARAFAVGSDVFMRSSEYRPGTNTGRKLLAHEIAHTFQQRGEHPQVQRSENVTIDPVQEITWGRVSDSYALLDLLRNLSRSKLKATRAGLQDFLESANPDDNLAESVKMAIEEINSILAGKTEAITIERCESTPPRAPIKVWHADPTLAAIMNGSRAAMRVGSSGFHVRLVQVALRYWGCEHAMPRGEYLGKHGVDGKYGKYTKNAVRAFQKQRGLGVDGRVGPETLTSLAEIAAAPDGEANAPEDVTCPPRVEGEYEWADSQPLSLTWSDIGEENGKTIRRWVLSGFPIGAATPLPAQGSIVSKLRAVFERLGPAGVRRRDVPAWNDYVCENLTRRVTIYGAGDCHAPELTAHLKAARYFTVSGIWPNSLNMFLISRDDASLTPADFETMYGRFPASTNASPEDRAMNRGVVLLEQIDTDLRGEFDENGEYRDIQREIEENLVRMRVKRDFRELYEKAAERVKTKLYKCMLDRMMFNGSEPIDTPQNEFVATRKQVESIRPIFGPSDSYHLGSFLLRHAMRNNLWIPRADDEPLTVCGQEQGPAEDPEEVMFQGINRMLDAVDSGKGLISQLKETEHGIAVQWWMEQNDKIGGLLSCYPKKKLFG